MSNAVDLRTTFGAWETKTRQANAMSLHNRSPRAARLLTRLQALAGDLDELWHDALDSQDFDLANVAIDVSNGIHRALLALDLGGIRR